MSDTTYCDDCLWWENYYDGHDPIIFNYSIYRYNEFMKEVIVKWKYRGDYSLGNMFQSDFVEGFQQAFSFLGKQQASVVPIPLSTDRLQERAFNQSQLLADILPLPRHNVLSRIHSEKQSKKTRKERVETKNPFSVTESLHNPIILVDDIYTTGTTLRHAASRLREKGCPRVYTYTLIRG
ncbi:ComF family protein [Oceanobacillus halotolerans]|uniref:ComF family protein n=1 Tax=Oceanobacillus halotolerans TaxID=2663380 RepID=UPI001CF7A467|nr:ComF family protein [Oceanobacillus halotolerans]